MSSEHYDITAILEILHGLVPPGTMRVLRRVVVALLWLSIVVLAWTWRPRVGAVLAANTVGIALVYFWRRRHAA
jgi:hypothetical protein